MHTLTELRTLLQQYRIAPRKQLGQHFLIEPATVARLVDQMSVTAQDTVVEVGPGFGALTLELARRAGHVTAVEYDRVLAHALKERLGDAANVEVLHGDILEVPLPPRSRVIGAIPYNITSPLLEHLMRHKRNVIDAWLIIQREVAQRLVARAGSQEYSRLSCFAAFHFLVTLGPRVARQAFHPQPGVDSILVHLVTRAAPPVQVADEAQFFAVIKAAFAHRRKTLLNNVLPLAGGNALRAAFEAHVRSGGIDSRRRGETLSLEEFAQVTSLVASFRH